MSVKLSNSYTRQVQIVMNQDKLV